MVAQLFVVRRPQALENSAIEPHQTERLFIASERSKSMEVGRPNAIDQYGSTFVGYDKWLSRRGCQHRNRIEKYKSVIFIVHKRTHRFRLNWSRHHSSENIMRRRNAMKYLLFTYQSGPQLNSIEMPLFREAAVPSP